MELLSSFTIGNGKRVQNGLSILRKRLMIDKKIALFQSRMLYSLRHRYLP